ncbi:hypothetical protein C0J52_22505, partial [Blattella germanica]
IQLLVLSVANTFDRFISGLRVQTAAAEAEAPFEKALPLADSTTIFGITAHRQKRGLKSIRDEGNNKVEHPVRHHGKHRRKPAIAPASTVSSYAQNVTLEHELCYSANQVLCIIAVTCAVNFAFIFVVMTLVHVCNRQHGTKLSGSERRLYQKEAIVQKSNILDISYVKTRRLVSRNGSHLGFNNAIAVSLAIKLSNVAFVLEDSIQLLTKVPGSKLVDKQFCTVYSFENISAYRERSFDKRARIIFLVANARASSVNCFPLGLEKLRSKQGAML